MLTYEQKLQVVREIQENGFLRGANPEELLTRGVVEGPKDVRQVFYRVRNGRLQVSWDKRDWSASSFDESLNRTTVERLLAWHRDYGDDAMRMLVELGESYRLDESASALRSAELGRLPQSGPRL